jgi:hypothetical protein
MITATVSNPLHNPFHNRFNDPVTKRLDEMQASAYMEWLRERHRYVDSAQSSTHATNSSAKIIKQGASGSPLITAMSGRQVFASVFALFVVLVSVAMLLRVF